MMNTWDLNKKYNKTIIHRKKHEEYLGLEQTETTNSWIYKKKRMTNTWDLHNMLDVGKKYN